MNLPIEERCLIRLEPFGFKSYTCGLQVVIYAISVNGYDSYRGHAPALQDFLMLGRLAWGSGFAVFGSLPLPCLPTFEACAWVYWVRFHGGEAFDLGAFPFHVTFL